MLKSCYGYSYKNHNISMICFYFLLRKAYHDFLLRIKKKKKIHLIKKKHIDCDFCQINEKHNMIL